MVWTCLALAMALCLALCWLLVTTEGTYLGTRVVALLYDWTAARYEKVKSFEFVYELRYLGLPLTEQLGNCERPWVLDVATGTGRLTRALCGASEGAHLVGLDRSWGMLAHGRLAGDSHHQAVVWMQGDAEHLPFAAQAFDAVACLEALEFVVRPEQAVAEMLRVLRPGGVVLLSNRVGLDAWLFVFRRNGRGRMCGRGRLERHLAGVGLHDIRTQRWQQGYDLVWARRPLGEDDTRGDEMPVGRWPDEEGPAVPC